MPSVKTKLFYDKQYMRILAGIEVMPSSILYIDFETHLQYPRSVIYLSSHIRVSVNTRHPGFPIGVSVNIPATIFVIEKTY